MTVAQRIIDLMAEKGVTQKELSEYADIPTSTISAWKTRGSSPSSDKLTIIAECLGVSAAELLGANSGVNIANNNNNSNCSVSVNSDVAGYINLNNAIVADTYNKLTEKEKLSVQMFILETAEKSEKSNATVNIIR